MRVRVRVYVCVCVCLSEITTLYSSITRPKSSIVASSILYMISIENKREDNYIMLSQKQMFNAYNYILYKGKQCERGK